MNIIKDKNILTRLLRLNHCGFHILFQIHFKIYVHFISICVPGSPAFHSGNMCTSIFMVLTLLITAQKYNDSVCKLAYCGRIPGTYGILYSRHVKQTSQCLTNHRMDSTWYNIHSLVFSDI